MGKKGFRTEETCALDGKHDDPEVLAECPVYRRQQREKRKALKEVRRQRAARMRAAKERKKHEATRTAAEGATKNIAPKSAHTAVLTAKVEASRNG